MVPPFTKTPSVPSISGANSNVLTCSLRYSHGFSVFMKHLPCSKGLQLHLQAHDSLGSSTDMSSDRGSFDRSCCGQFFAIRRSTSSMTYRSCSEELTQSNSVGDSRLRELLKRVLATVTPLFLSHVLPLTLETRGRPRHEPAARGGACGHNVLI